MKPIAKSKVAFLVSLAAFVAFAAVIQPIPHSGESVYVLAQKLGANPLPSFLHPVYGWVVQGLAAVSGDALYYAINLFSALCSALSLGLVFALVYRVTRKFNVENSIRHDVMHRIQLFSGVVAVLYLLAASPVWLASTRAGPLAFDILLLLTAFYLVVSYTGKSGPARMMLAVLLYGVAVVEFTTAILFGPVFALLVVIMLYMTGTMRSGLFFKLILCGLLGLSVYLLQAGFYALSPVYEWREFKHIFQVIWYVWIEQYQSLTRGLPRQGWLTLALVCLLPWVITYSMSFSKKSGVATGTIFGRIALHVVLLVLAIVLLLDIALAPAIITGTQFLYVTPYILIALWVGNVTAFWSVTLFRVKRFERPWATKTRKALGYVFVVTLPLYVLVLAGAKAIPAASADNDVIVQRAAEAMLDAAEGKKWLISNSIIDDHLALEIRRRGADANLIRAGFGRSQVYMKYLAGLFSENPRLESLALIGFGPFIEQWLTSSPDVVNDVAIVNISELWLAVGVEALPDRILFAGLGEGEPPLDKAFRDAREFWGGFGLQVVEAGAGTGASGASINWLKIHLSKIANNLGVMLEDAGRNDDAFVCYEQAALFAPDNLSALMNMHALAQRQERPELDALEAILQEKTKDLIGKVQAVSLSQVYGYVRVPDLFVRRGMTFALSGKASMAAAEIKRALALREGNSQLQLALAGLYFGQQQDLESKEVYLQVLAENPANPQALLGLIRLNARQSDFVEARRLLEALKEAGAPASVVKVEEAFLESLSGAPLLAMRLLQDAVKEDEKNVTALTALAAIATDLNEQKVAEEAINKVQAAKVFSPALQLIMAQTAVRQNDRIAARRHLGELLKRQPWNISALEMMLRIDLSEGDRDAVQKNVERILTVEPGNALANYMLGVHHYYREEFLLAESAYRASLATRKSPEALNDLAYVLHLQGRSGEAEAHIRESLEMNDRNPPAWDTLGTILMALNRLDEAQQALQQSLALRPDSAGVMLSLALLYEKQDRLTESEAMAKQVNARQNELSSEQQASIRELMRRLSDAM